MYNWNYLSESVSVCLKWCDFSTKSVRDRNERARKSFEKEDKKNTAFI